MNEETTVAVILDEDTVAAVQEIGYRLKHVATAIFPSGTVPNDDAAGVRVESLTEAVMGMTAATVQVADALRSIADAIRERS